MNKPSKAATNQLRWSMPWRGIGIRCRGCRYLTEAGAGFQQCTASWDGFSVISPEAICLGRPTNFSANSPALDETRTDIIDDVEEEEPNNCCERELCPRCGGAFLSKKGCWVCPNCQYKECS